MKTDNAPLQIYPCMCEKQLQDLNTILQAVDDFGANTLALSSQGPQGYAIFIQSRDSLRQLIQETSKHYRLVA